MRLRDVLMSRTPMAMVLVATREAYRAFDKYRDDQEADRRLFDAMQNQQYGIREIVQ